MENLVLNLSIDTKHSFYNKKEAEDKISWSHNEMIRRTDQQYTTDELDYYFSNGHTWSPAVFGPDEGGNTNRAIQNWKSQQVFALDFDHNMTLQQFIETARLCGIYPMFVYHTFSHSEVEDRFRAVFVMDTNITDRRIRDWVQLCLAEVFDGNSDSQCYDAARLFFGGKEVIHYEPSYLVSIESLNTAVILKLSADKKNAARKMVDFCRERFLYLVDGYPGIIQTTAGDSLIEENNATSINNIIELALNSSKIDDTDSVKEGAPKPEVFPADIAFIDGRHYRFLFSVSEEDYKARVTPYAKSDVKTKGRRPQGESKKVKTEGKIKIYRNVNLDEINEKCRLLGEIKDGTFWAYHNQLIQVAMNLMYLEGGETWLYDVLNQYEEYRRNDKPQKIRTAIRYFKSRQYKPMCCKPSSMNGEAGCPYYEECRAKTILWKVLDTRRGQIKQITDYLELPLAQAEEALSEWMYEAFAAEDNNVHVLKAPTGIGKTQSLMELLKDRDNVAIAVPRHKLAKEVLDRLKNAEHNDFLYIPERPKLREEIEKQAEKFETARLFSKVTKLIFEEARRLEFEAASRPLTDEEKAVLEYVSAIKKAKTATKILTTHERIMFLENPNIKTVIIDEDSTPSILKTGQTNYEDLEFIVKSIKDDETRSSMKSLLRDVDRADEKKMMSLPVYGAINKKDIASAITENADKIDSDAIEFFHCRHYIKYKGDIHFIQSRISSFSRDKKYIIMSATANETIYERLFSKDRLRFHEIGPVETKGELIMPYGQSYSRSCLKQNTEEKFIKVRDLIPSGTNCITFKGQASAAEKAGLNIVATFGATAGLDSFGGQDLAVIGTPHVNNITYMLYAAALGEPVTIFDQGEMDYQLIQRNGYEFYFNTYSDNPMLKEIQLWLIESELIQAVGRARILRNDCTVYLFSNFPLPQVILR